jgi:hypothetical protein
MEKYIVASHRKKRRKIYPVERIDHYCITKINKVVILWIVTCAWEDGS